VVVGHAAGADVRPDLADGPGVDWQPLVDLAAGAVAGCLVVAERRRQAALGRLLCPQPQDVEQPHPAAGDPGLPLFRGQPGHDGADGAAFEVGGAVPVAGVGPHAPVLDVLQQALLPLAAVAVVHPPADGDEPQPVPGGVLGGELRGARPFVLIPEVGEHAHDPVAGPGLVGGLDEDPQHGLGVLAAGDVGQHDVVAGQVRGGDRHGRRGGDLAGAEQRVLAGQGPAGGAAWCHDGEASLVGGAGPVILLGGGAPAPPGWCQVLVPRVMRQPPVLGAAGRWLAVQAG
jgi:hypothetical protein